MIANASLQNFIVRQSGKVDTLALSIQLSPTAGYGSQNVEHFLIVQVFMVIS